MRVIVKSIEVPLITLQGDRETFVVGSAEPTVHLALSGDQLLGEATTYMTDAELHKWTALTAAICERMQRVLAAGAGIPSE